MGKPPFTYRFSFAGKRHEESTSSPTATFSTTENGLFRLDEFSDFFNYTVKPEVQILREVKFVAPPIYNIHAPAYACDNAAVDVSVNIQGHAPFNVQYPNLFPNLLFFHLLYPLSPPLPLPLSFPLLPFPLPSFSYLIFDN